MDIHVLTIYIPPQTKIEHLLGSLSQILQKYNLCPLSTVVLGDFNVNIDTISSSQKQLLDFFSHHHYKQLVHASTTDNNTCIDHIYTGIPNVTAGIWETYYSYHKAIWLNLLN